MSSPKSTHRVFIEQYIEDGEWHDMSALVDECVKVVPPGKAYRKYGDDRKRDIDTDERILRGARRLVRQAIYGMVVDGRIERRHHHAYLPGAKAPVRIVEVRKPRANSDVVASAIDENVKLRNRVEELEQQLATAERVLNLVHQAFARVLKTQAEVDEWVKNQTT